ncbi:hypothetical protein PUN28_002123 [Cardiocondyla obscurior]|uniref:Uncharacterized protein n=1 Tax=Cardiocondyla obscurior TaxID=286306 RepID=A0AAW2GSS6_9HYME
MLGPAGVSAGKNETVRGFIRVCIYIYFYSCLFTKSIYRIVRDNARAARAVTVRMFIRAIDSSREFNPGFSAEPLIKNATLGGDKARFTPRLRRTLGNRLDGRRRGRGLCHGIHRERSVEAKHALPRFYP